MENKLKYPKSQFSRADVIKEKNKFRNPELWIIEEDSKNYYLTLTHTMLSKSLREAIKFWKI